MRRFSLALLAVVTCALPAAPAAAWTRPGHMVTAAIAYDEIERTDPKALQAIGEILDAHPDKGPFEVAIDRTSGPERRRRMFLECARWPDDARRTPFDHSSWHVSLRALLAKDATPEAKAAAEAHVHPAGQAVEAFALNYRMLKDPRTPAPDRAVALCWVLHLVGDIHQPLHTAEQYSKALPDGDRGGARQYVQDPLGPTPIVLHWLWDDAIHRSGVAASADARGREIAGRFPRAALPELAGTTRPDQFVAWRDESYALAGSVAYDLAASLTPQDAPALTPDQWKRVREIAERRVAVASYRMADLVILVLSGAP